MSNHANMIQGNKTPGKQCQGCARPVTTNAAFQHKLSTEFYSPAMTDHRVIPESSSPSISPYVLQISNIQFTRITNHQSRQKTFGKHVRRRPPQSPQQRTYKSYHMNEGRLCMGFMKGAWTERMRMTIAITDENLVNACWKSDADASTRYKPKETR